MLSGWRRTGGQARWGGSLGAESGTKKAEKRMELWRWDARAMGLRALIGHGAPSRPLPLPDPGTAITSASTIHCTPVLDHSKPT